MILIRKKGIRAYREWHQRVDNAGNDPLLNQSQHQVETNNNLQSPSQEEGFPDPPTPGEIQLVTQGRGEPEVVHVEDGEVVRVLNQSIAHMIFIRPETT